MAHLWLGGRRFARVCRDDFAVFRQNGCIRHNNCDRQASLLRPNSSPAALLASSRLAARRTPVHLPGSPNFPAALRVTALTRTESLQRMARIERNSRTPSADKFSAVELHALEHNRLNDQSVMGPMGVVSQTVKSRSSASNPAPRRFYATRRLSNDRTATNRQTGITKFQSRSTAPGILCHSLTGTDSGSCT